MTMISAVTRCSLASQLNVRPSRNPAAIVAGFDLHTFERFPSMLGVSRGEVMAMLQSSAQGFHVLGAPGWKMGDAIGVLTTKDGRKVFQNKSEILDATPERVAAVEEFRAE